MLPWLVGNHICMAMKAVIESPKNDGVNMPRKQRAAMILLALGLPVVISAVGIRSYRSHVANEARRQEVAAAEARRMAELQTVRNAHDFFGKVIGRKPRCGAKKQRSRVTFLPSGIGASVWKRGSALRPVPKTP